MPRPAKKKTRVLAEAAKTGELNAILKHEFKVLRNKKHFLVSLKNHIGKMVDRVDPLKLASVLVLTVVIKTGIEWAEEAITAIRAENVFKTMYRVGMGVLGLLLPESPSPEEIRKAFDTPIVEVFEWGISFAVAYIIVEHGAELVAAGGNILGVAKGLLGGFVGGIA